MSSFIKQLTSCTIILIVLTNLVVRSTAVKCWDCSSYTDPNCGDPFNKSTLLVTDCDRIADADQQRCIKIKQQVGDHWRYIRGCVAGHIASLPNATEYICEHDGCNDAASCGPIVTLVVSTFILVAYLTTI